MPFTKEDYKVAKKSLSLTHLEMGLLLGKSERSSEDYLKGSMPVQDPVARVIHLWLTLSTDHPKAWAQIREIIKDQAKDFR